MTQLKNGRVMIGPIGEADGVARVIKSGQVVCTRHQLMTKLERYIADPRKSEEDRAMYAAQLKDVKGETANG